ncbi:MAG: MFS transporter, partial [Natronospirillum sp.]
MTTLFAYIGLIRQHWPMLVFGLMTVFWGNLGQSFLFSWYGTPIQQTFGLSASLYGGLYSAATLGSSFCLLALGGAIDRWPLRWFIVVVSMGLFAAALLLATTSNIVMLILAMFLLRFCGQALMPHTAMTTMARFFSNNRGKAISVANNGVPLGEMILPLTVVSLIAWVGWQHSWYWLAMSIPLVYIPLAWWLLSRARAPEKAPAPDVNAISKDADPRNNGNRRTVLRDPRFWRALPLLLLPPFAVTGIFIQSGFIITERGWPPTLLASAFVVYGAVHWATSMWVGSLVDRLTAARLLSAIAVPFIAAFTTGALVGAPWGAWVMMTSLGAGIGIAGPITNALWAEIYGTRHLGSIRSLTTSLMVMSTAAAPVLLGAFIDLGVTLGGFFGSLLVYAVVSGLLSWRAYPP